MQNHITKTDFVRLDCPLYAWLWKNRPDLREGHQNSRIADQGYEVEKIAQELFKGQEVSFQAEAKTQNYLLSHSSIMNGYFNEIGFGIAMAGNKLYIVTHYGTSITSNPLPICDGGETQ